MSGLELPRPLGITCDFSVLYPQKVETVRRVDKDRLDRWHQAHLSDILPHVAIYAKADPTYLPALDQDSTRWHLSAAGGEFELLLTGSKFFDTRAGKGGGGAVDLVMHIDGVSFKDATRSLVLLGL